MENVEPATREGGSSADAAPANAHAKNEKPTPGTGKDASNGGAAEKAASQSWLSSAWRR